VALDDLTHARGKTAVVNGDVDLEVETQRQVIEVERADGGPLAIDHGRLAVQHVALPLVDAHPGVHQPLPHGTARVVHHGHVADARYEHAYVHPPARRRAQRAHHASIGDEVRVGDPDVLA